LTERTAHADVAETEETSLSDIQVPCQCVCGTSDFIIALPWFFTPGYCCMLMQTLMLASALTRLMWSNATIQSRAVTISRYHASQLPQPLPQYYTVSSRAATDSGDADLHG